MRLLGRIGDGGPCAAAHTLLEPRAVPSCSLQHPVRTYGYAFLFSLTGYFGVSFVLALIKIFGALVAVTGKEAADRLSRGTFAPESPTSFLEGGIQQAGENPLGL